MRFYVFECYPHVSRSMSAECSKGECVVHAFKFNPKHSVAEIAEKQKNCPDVGPVYKAFIHDPVKAPTWMI